MSCSKRTTASLVSVTQKIDTTTTMGRFLGDLLMLLAQFEPEMIAERTYEKMAEQAQKVRWSGGHPTLGYDWSSTRNRRNSFKHSSSTNISKLLRLCEPHVGRTTTATERKSVRYSNGREVW